MHEQDVVRFPVVEAGEWIRPPADEPFLFQCCECLVVHALTFDHDEDGRIIFMAVEVGTVVDKASQGS